MLKSEIIMNVIKLSLNAFQILNLFSIKNIVLGTVLFLKNFIIDGTICIIEHEINQSLKTEH